MVQQSTFRLIAIIWAIIVTGTHWAAGQQNGYPLVNVNDSVATVAGSTFKTYTTTIRLFPALSSTTFVNAAFITSIDTFYETSLDGFQSAEVVKSNVVVANSIDVTYNVLYRYSTLNATYGPDNNQAIVDAIGTFSTLSSSLLSSPLTTLYSVKLEGASAFSFTGVSLCSAVVCPTNTQCNETVDGVQVECVSPCKMNHCKNNGTCSQESTLVPPTCSCLSRSDVWFLGAQCETTVALWMVIIGAVGALLLLIAAIIIACCCYYSKRRKKEKEAYMHDVKDLKGYNNAAYLRNEKEVNIYSTRPQGFQERSVDAATAVAATRRRSSSRSRDRDQRRHTSRSRRRRSRSSSYRRRRSRSRERRARRMKEEEERRRREDESSESSEEETTSEESSDEEQVDARTRNVDSQNADTSFDEDTDSTSSSDDDEGGDVSLKDQGTSPIRWKPPSEASSTMPRGIDIAARKGWQPSLGPQMFELKTAEATSRPTNESDEESSTATDDSSRYATVPTARYIPDTDI